MTDPSMQWKRGDYCIAKYKDNVFYRVRIIATPEGKMKNLPIILLYAFFQ
jgi:hypothetical protein